MKGQWETAEAWSDAEINTCKGAWMDGARAKRGGEGGGRDCAATDGRMKIMR